MFSDIIGQHQVKQQLVEMVQHNRLSHALLFLGKEGNGSLQLAMALAQYITCEKANPRSRADNQVVGLFSDESSNSRLTTHDSWDSCGVCSSCIKAEKLVHPDI